MVQRPFFSVVIPTLNEGRYLPRLLESLIVQIDKSFQVIVVDGKSEDRTMEKARRFSIRIPDLSVYDIGVRNVSKQRNFGSKKARGKFLIFLDADVLVPKNFLSEMHFYLDKRDEECKFLTTWSEPDSTDSLDKLVVNFANMGIEIGKVIDKPLVGGYNIVVEARVFRKIGGFDEKWVPGVSEDHDLARRLLKNGVELQILKNPKIIVSLRRFRREGTLTVLRKYAVALSRVFAESGFTPGLYDYEMGGRAKGTKKKTARQISEVSLEKFMKFFKLGNY